MTSLDRITSHPMRVDSSLLAPNHLKACVEWVASLGLVPADLAAIFAILRGPEGWELHATEHLRNENGRKYIDLASQGIVSRPVVVQLGPDECWPDLAEGRIL